MNSYKFELNREGVKQLMQSAEMRALLDETAQHIADNAEGAYKVDTRTGKTRANAQVSCADAHTYYSNLKHNNLLKAMASTRRE